MSLPGQYGKTFDNAGVYYFATTQLMPAVIPRGSLNVIKGLEDNVRVQVFLGDVEAAHELDGSGNSYAKTYV